MPRGSFLNLPLHGPPRFQCLPAMRPMPSVSKTTTTPPASPMPPRRLWWQRRRQRCAYGDRAKENGTPQQLTVQRLVFCELGRAASLLVSGHSHPQLASSRCSDLGTTVREIKLVEHIIIVFLLLMKWFLGYFILLSKFWSLAVTLTDFF
jgi:hypothetical protein